MRSDLSINPTFASFVDYLPGLFRLIHSNSLKISFTLFPSNSQSKTAEGSIPCPNWEAGVSPPPLPFTEPSLQSSGARVSSLVMASGAAGPASHAQDPTEMLGSAVANRASQLLCVAPLHCLSRVSRTPHSSGREQSWHFHALSQGWGPRPALAVVSLRARPALWCIPHPDKPALFLPTQPDQTALRKQSGIHISAGCRRRRQSSVVGRGSRASSTFQLTTAGPAPLPAAASAPAPLQGPALWKALFWLGTSLLSFLVLKSHTETFPSPMACDPANLQAHIPNMENNNLKKKKKKRGGKKKSKVN